MILTHCLDVDCLRSEPGPCRCECVGCCVARIAFLLTEGRVTCTEEGELMEEVAHSIRRLELHEDDVVVLSFQDKLTESQVNQVYTLCRTELDVASHRVIVLQEGAQMSTAYTLLNEQRLLLEDAAKCIAALAGVVQHSTPHPDSVVAERDRRILSYAKESADLIRRQLMEVAEVPTDRPALAEAMLS